MASTKYLNSENKRLRETKNRIKIEEDKLSQMKVSDNEFMDQYALVNDLRLRKITIESRIENMGNFPHMPDHTFLT